MSSGLGRWIDGESPESLPPDAATDRTRTGLWTQVERGTEGRATGFSVHGVGDFAAGGRIFEWEITRLGAPPGEWIERLSQPGQAPRELGMGYKRSAGGNIELFEAWAPAPTSAAGSDEREPG